MAYIEPPRVRQDGTLVYRVRWRKGGGAAGKREGEPFTDKKAAEDFRDAVTRAGDEWPWGYVPGIGWDHQAYAALLQTQERAPAIAVTFADFAEEWVGSRTKASKSMREKYRDDIRLHLNPFFGEQDITDDNVINEKAVNDWVNALFDGHHDRGPLKRNTVHRLHGMLSGILKLAVRRKLRSTNPCQYSELPPRNTGAEQDEMVFLTRQEFHLFAQHLKADVQAMVIVLVNTGLRWGELSALQVQDVKNLSGDKPYIRIRRAWKRLDDNTYVLGPPKSPRSRRNVSVSKTIARILAAAVEGKRPTDYIFTTSQRHVPWRHNNFYDARWRPALYRAMRCEKHRTEDAIGNIYKNVRNRHLIPCGCPGTLEKAPRIHDMRHSHASWLIADGAQLPEVQRRLGHQHLQTTERYIHLLPELDDQLISRLEDGWTRSLPRKLRALAA